MRVAEYFKKFDDNRINELVVDPPYDAGKEKLNQWVRGSIKFRSGPDAFPQPLVITGPKLRICFGGCKWNKMVFAIPKGEDEQDPAVREFHTWLQKVATKVKATIMESPEKYKPGSKSAARFQFEDDIVKPSSDPDKYPDELRCRLSTIRREMTDTERNQHNDAMFDPTADHVEFVDADIFTVSDGAKLAVDPATVTSRSSLIPVVRLAYYRHGDKFGLDFIITKGQYFPNDSYQSKVLNSEWVLDVPESVPEPPSAKRQKLDPTSSDSTTVNT